MTYKVIFNEDYNSTSPAVVHEHTCESEFEALKDFAAIMAIVQLGVDSHRYPAGKVSFLYDVMVDGVGRYYCMSVDGVPQCGVALHCE